MGALGVSYVVEQGQDESGTWYRRFSNGWVEQGGKVIATGNWTTVQLPIEFRNDEYTVNATQYLSNRGNWDSNFSISEITNTSFNVWTGSAESNNGNSAHWEAKGFAA